MVVGDEVCTPDSSRYWRLDEWKPGGGQHSMDKQYLRDWLAEFRDAHDEATPKSALVLVGPEGDFTPAELGLARSAGCRPITLGPIVLRVETAALYCLSVLSYELLAG